MSPLVAVCRRFPGDERGAVLVELALVLPIFVAFLVVIVDLGLLLREYAIIQNAAREGARYSIIQRHQIGAYPDATLGAIQQKVLDYLQQEGITDVSAAAVSVSQTCPIVVDGYTLHGSCVTVTYSRPVLLVGPLVPVSPTVTLTATTLYRNFYY